MPDLSKDLAKDLATDLSVDLAGGDGAVFPSYGDGFFTNASPRYLIDPITPRVIGPFAGDVPALVTIGGRQYLQIEGARTNLQVRSQEFDDAAWSKTNLSSIGDDTTDPAGNVTADKLLPNTANSQHKVRDVFAVVNGTTYATSLFAKDGGYDWVIWQLTSQFPSPSVYFDVNNGAIGGQAGSPGGIAVDDFGTGYYRGTWTKAAIGTGNATLDIWVASADGTITYVGDGSSHEHWWNFQVEAGAFPSSPIHTEASGVTRARDQFYWDIADIPAAMISGIWSVKLIPFFAHNELSGGVNWLYRHNGLNSGIFYDGIAKTFEVWDGSKKAESKALTFDRYQELTLTMNTITGTINVAGATSGDGDGPTAAAWDWSGLLTFTVGANTMVFGLLSEPYAP